MKTGLCFKRALGNRRGAVAVIVALLSLVLFMFVALAIDIGYLAVTKNELQNIADAGALAGARRVGRLYECNGDIINCTESMSYEDQQTYAVDPDTVGDVVSDVASRNQAGGRDSIIINDTDIVIGQWNSDTVPGTINPVTPVAPTAVRVTARRDSQANNAITTFFAGVMGVDTLEVSADATAALSGLSSMAEGYLPIPVAINHDYVRTMPCNEDFVFHPSSGDVCSAWHVYQGNDYKNPSGSQMKKMIEDMTAFEFSSPETTAYDSQYVFTNGELANLFTSEAIQNLFHTMKVINEPPLDNDDDPETWTTYVAVYDDTVEGCSPNREITIVGFAAVKITAVAPPPETTIYAQVVCDLIGRGNPNGTNYGVLSAIPGLVE